MADSQLLVNQIIPFSNVDGEGNRCSIFLQGCNINCAYCHNSETINRCSHCGKCVEVCEPKALYFEEGKVVFDQSICIDCHRCIAICPFNASPKAKNYSIEELVTIIGQYKPYIRGVTVSGGEPTLQWPGIVDLFTRLQGSGLTRYVDTNGFMDLRKLPELVAATDGFMLDVKALDTQKSLCGSETDHLLDNLSFLLEKGKIIEVRTVIISGLVDVSNVIMEVAVRLSSYPDIPYRLIRGHLTGLKPERRERLESMIPSDEDMSAYRQMVLDHGHSNVTLQL